MGVVLAELAITKSLSAPDTIPMSVCSPPKTVTVLPKKAGRPVAPALAPLGLFALMVFLGFSAGGFFAGTTGLVTVAVGLALVLWVTLAPRPFAGLTTGLVVAAALLAGLAVWTLASALWSDSPARALLEFDRTLLYLLALVAFGLMAPSPDDRRRLVWALAAASALLCAAGLATRLLPEVWSLAPDLQEERLGYPLTYWNALGLLAVLGLVACLHLTSSTREPAAVRVLAAAAFPVLATTLLLTFSRASIALAPAGVLVYLLLARPRGALGGLLAAGPPTAVALAAAYGADALSSAQAPVSRLVAEGQEVALIVGACVAGAALLRLALLAVDARVERIRLSPHARRGAAAGATAVALAAAVVAGAVADVPDRLAQQVQRFTSGDYVSSGGDRRERLLDAGNNGRLDHWAVALDAFSGAPVLGRGAGTYELAWAQQRPYDFNVIDAHSLYLETLAELGVVGLVLLAGALLALLVAALARIRGPERALGAAGFVLVGLWAVRAGVDWDWEMPAVTVPTFALGGALLARTGASRARRVAAPHSTVRVVIGLGVLVLLVTPALVTLSQARLDDAVRALRAGECPRAVDEALAANAALGVRPDPFVVLGYCDVRLGRPDLGIRAFQAALRRDPGSWRLHYGLALVRAAAGLDPRPAARAALARNPRSELTRDLVQRFDTDDPRTWRRRAASARLPF